MKCTVKIDEKLQKEINEKTWLGSLIALIVGAIGLGVYIFVGVFVDEPWLEVFLWVMAFTFAIGLTMLISVNKINKKSAQNNFVNELNLQEECVDITTSKNGEIVSTLKTYYRDLLKVRESENYLILYINKASAIPVPKNAFTSEEFSTIKLWVNSAKIKQTKKD